jgi:hypothetical protein
LLQVVVAADSQQVAVAALEVCAQQLPTLGVAAHLNPL